MRLEIKEVYKKQIMKTTLTDNSLCVYPLCDGAEPELIYKYIGELRDTGVDYIELDFRTLIKLKKLPRGVKYIFRMVDPMFLPMTEFYEFSYVVLTYNDLKEKIGTDVPVLFEIPYLKNSVGKALRFAESRVDGKISALRIRSSFEYCKPSEIKSVYKKLCAVAAPLPVDICPLNEYKTALDTALKFTAADVSSLTLAAGLPMKYCSLEEYIFSFMSVFDGLPPKLNINSLGGVSVFRSRIFQTGTPALPTLLNVIDHDIRCLKNADTGESVDMRVKLKNTEFLNSGFISVLEKMADYENIPDDVFENISEAIKHYDSSIYNDELLRKKRRGLLN